MSRAFSGSNRYVLDYLAEEVLNRQSSGTRVFLVETSILERLCGPLCDAVTERSDSQSMLARLEAANLFIAPMDNERRWYRYHQLFAAILSTILSRSAPERMSGLHRRASVWYEHEGMTEEAIDQSLLGGDAERAIDLLEKTAPHMLGRGPAARFLAYVPRIPEPLLPNCPWLCVAFAWAALTADAHEVFPPMISRAWEALSQNPAKMSPGSRANLQRIKGHALSIQSLIASVQGDIPLPYGFLRRLAGSCQGMIPRTG